MLLDDTLVRAADAVTTALRIMGMDTHDFFIPGGPGRVSDDS